MKIDIDRLGIVASGICAVHCLLFPLLISFGVASGFWTSANHGTLEWGTFVLSVALAGASFYYGYKRHMSITPAVAFGMGIVMISYGLVQGGSGMDHMLMGLGGLIIVIGHYQNRQLLLNNRLCCPE